MKQALIYVRVSTPGQAKRDRDPEGYSIPAQREACTRKAESLEATVVDAGESARSADRTELQRMLNFLQQNRSINYVIVHKVDRLARNREDDVSINLAIRKAGAQLVSCTENIDETPSGRLVHGIMATIADFYSSNLAAEVVKGMTQKAKTGGTVTRAPLGYINRHELVDGQDIRWVDIDDSRAELVRLAFKLYATGEYSIVALAELLSKKGLLSRATKRRSEHALTKTTLAQMLASPYYTGTTTYQGAQYSGKHPALIDPALFRQVQDVLKARLIGEKQRVHMHYLKGTIFCGRCGSRLCVTFQKQQYLYYFCLGRSKNNGCTLPYLKADEIETQITRYYSLIRLSKAEADNVRQAVHAYIKDNQADFTAECKRQRLLLEQLESEHAKLLQAYYAGIMPLDVFGSEQARITTAKQHATETLTTAEQGFDDVATKLNQALDLMRNWRNVYEEAPKPLRRKLNQTFFEAIYIQESDELVTTNGSQLS